MDFLNDIDNLKPGRTGRVSSWDRSGGNADFAVIEISLAIFLNRFSFSLSFFGLSLNFPMMFSFVIGGLNR